MFIFMFLKTGIMLISKYNIDTGAFLDVFLKKNRITRAVLGRGIGRNGLSVLNYITSSSMQTSILLDICYALKHNFFQDMAHLLPADFTVSEDLKSGKDLRIAELEEENKVLKIQNEILLRVRN